MRQEAGGFAGSTIVGTLAYEQLSLYSMIWQRSALLLLKLARPSPDGAAEHSRAKLTAEGIPYWPR